MIIAIQMDDLVSACNDAHMKATEKKIDISIKDPDFSYLLAEDWIGNPKVF